MVDTAKFNVGGKHFEVSRALVDEHSDTVLGKLVSDAWNDDPGKAVFIDRSGDIFAHVLEYLRYGSIELPVTIPRSMFDRELDYYGITSVEATIDKESLPKIMDSFTIPLAQAQRKHDAFFLAHECYAQFNKNRQRAPKSNSAMVKVSSASFVTSGTHFDRELCVSYLERYFGLTAKDNVAPGKMEVFVKE